MQYVYALNPVCIVLIIPGHSRRKFPVRAVDIVNPGIQMTIHRTWHTLINIGPRRGFNSLFRVCLIFYTHTILRTSKVLNNTMKKMFPATVLALLITGCAQQTFTVQNKPAAVAPKETITHHFFVSELGRRKSSMQPKFVGWRRKNVVKTETQQTFVNGLLGFITLGIYTPLEARVLLTIIGMSCPSIWATLSALLINILLGSFQLFLHSDQPLRVK